MVFLLGSVISSQELEATGWSELLMIFADGLFGASRKEGKVVLCDKRQVVSRSPKPSGQSKDEKRQLKPLAAWTQEA